MGIDGLYLATSLAVVPPLVSTKISVALAEFAVRTADDARLSNGLIGIGADNMIDLKTAE
jgi:hypothetical protein